MESSMAMLRLGGILTTLILLSTLGKIAESKVVAVRSQPSCIDEARESLNRSHDPDNLTVTGSYARYDVEQPQDDAIVKQIVVSGVRLYMYQEKRPKDFRFRANFGEVEAYKKSVYGDTYCVQFIVKIVQCSNAEDCILKKRTTCSLSAHKELNANEIRIDTESLDCRPTAVA